MAMASITNRYAVGKLCLLALSALVHAESVSVTSSAKRGLIFTPNSLYPKDNYIWPLAPSDLTWYYNYGPWPSVAFNNVSQESFEFVPMLWGAPDNASDISFLNDVKEVISEGTNVTHIMTFNEPDGTTASGGSDIDPTLAAEVWVSNIIPLQKMGIKVGLPACTGGWDSVPWLQQMLGNCSKLISSSSKTKNCTYDFIPLHWYGNFEGLASHIGTYSAAFPNTSLWVTEYADNDQDLADTQSFFNSSLNYLDRLASIERYSYFGAFRSSVSNVGPNVAMLNSKGKLTNIGAWYLGREATGVVPDSAAFSSIRSMSRTSIAWMLSAAFTSVVVPALF